MSNSQLATVNAGRTLVLFDGTLTGNATKTVNFVLHADTLLLSVFVRSVANSVTVSCDTFTLEGEASEVILFPAVSAPTTELILKKAAVALANCKLKINHTANCELQVVAKGLTAGELNTRILSANTATAYSASVTNTAAVLIPATLFDRSGLVIKNTSSASVYIGFSLAEATIAGGWLLTQNESLSIDLAAGQAVFAVRATPGTSDIRIIEAMA